MNTALLSDINWPAVLVAAIAYFALGALWYSKAFFGPAWVKLAGIDMNDPNIKKGIAKTMIASFVLIIITCISLALFIERMDLFVFGSAIKLGLITGLGFSTTAVAISFLYEKRPTGIYFIDCGYHVVGNLTAAVILILWR